MYSTINKGVINKLTKLIKSHNVPPTIEMVDKIPKYYTHIPIRINIPDQLSIRQNAPPQCATTDPVGFPISTY